MKFLIITHVIHKQVDNKIYAYGPYIREMNIWLKYAGEVVVVAPLCKTMKAEEIDSVYNHTDIEFIQIPEFDIKGIKSILRTVFLLPVLTIRIAKGIRRSDHIHLRCPGNIGLLGCIIQIFSPGKQKTAKYAGNWDWGSKQPWSYRLQQRILRNTFLTRNMTALVYGEWPDKTENIKPFFTASYFERDRLPVNKIRFEDGINLAFVGGLYEFKSPFTSLEVLKEILGKGINAKLTYCGDGTEREKLMQAAENWGISNKVIFLGNVDSETVKSVLQEAHFLIFISKSEGWPKAVAEAMWWGCLPVTTAVSCVPQMLGNGERGELVENDVPEIVSIIEHYIKYPSEFFLKTGKAMEWSREYTLEKFDSEIKQLLIK
jgi:glycosyltransferase involved in cell wall biosynthesis